LVDDEEGAAVVCGNGRVVGDEQSAAGMDSDPSEAPAARGGVLADAGAEVDHRLVAHAEDGAAGGVHHVHRSQPYLPVSSPTEESARSVMKRHHTIVRLRRSLVHAQRAAAAAAVTAA